MSRSYTARNAHEAFALVEKDKIDVILSDVRMPGGDGIELVQMVRESGRWQLPILLNSGFTESSTEMIYDVGAFDFIKKPARANYLENAVANYLRPLSERLKRSYRPIKSGISIKLSLDSLASERARSTLAFGSIGFFLKDNAFALKLGDEFEFQFDLPGDKTKLMGIGVCRWQRSNPQDLQGAGVGAEIIEIDDLSMNFYENYLNHIKPKSAIPKSLTQK